MKYYIDVVIRGKQYLDDDDMEMLDSLSFEQKQQFLEKLRKDIADFEFIIDLYDRKIYLEYCGEKE